jgi:hypothetical protein
VFSNPVKILQWILPLNTELKRVLFSCVVCTMSLCPPGRVSSSRTSSSSVLLCTYAPAQCPPGRALRILSDSASSLNFSTEVFLCAPLSPLLNALLAELHRILSDSGFCLNSQQSSSNCTLCLCSMPTWQSFTELTAKFCLQLCLSYTALPPRCSTTLRSSFELLTPVLVPQHVFV